MKNILLILENSLEFDLTKTVLVRLGFNVIWIQKGVDMNEKLQKNFPDLVITSILGKQDEFLNEFIEVREKRGVPKFIWAGPVHRLEKLKPAQRKLIDANLDLPIQPDQLIQTVCQLFELDAKEYVAKYRALLTGHGKEIKKVSSESPLIRDTERSAKYSQLIQKVEKQDKVFTVKDLLKRTRLEGDGGNTIELFEKKKHFVKALFKK